MMTMLEPPLPPQTPPRPQFAGPYYPPSPSGNWGTPPQQYMGPPPAAATFSPIMNQPPMSPVLGYQGGYPPNSPMCSPMPMRPRNNFHPKRPRQSGTSTSFTNPPPHTSSPKAAIPRPRSEAQYNLDDASNTTSNSTFSSTDSSLEEPTKKPDENKGLQSSNDGKQCPTAIRCCNNESPMVHQQCMQNHGPFHGVYPQQANQQV